MAKRGRKRHLKGMSKKASRRKRGGHKKMRGGLEHLFGRKEGRKSRGGKRR
jgi:hypothetical protein